MTNQQRVLKKHNRLPLAHTKLSVRIFSRFLLGTLCTLACAISCVFTPLSLDAQNKNTRTRQHSLRQASRVNQLTAPAPGKAAQYFLTLKSAYLENKREYKRAEQAHTQLARHMGATTDEQPFALTASQARIFFDTHQYDKLKALALPLKKNLTKAWRPVLLLAQVYILTDESDKALEILKQLRLHWPAVNSIAYYLAVCYYSKGEYGTVREIADACIADKRRMTKSPLFFNLAAKAADAQKLPEAAAQYRSKIPSQIR